MNDPRDDSAFDSALRDALHAAAEPADDGFSLRVMAALPRQAAPRSAAVDRLGRWVRWTHWTALSLAAGALAMLFADAGLPADVPHALARVTLIGLLIAWSWPGRWLRG